MRIVAMVPQCELCHSVSMGKGEQGFLHELPYAGNSSQRQRSRFVAVAHLFALGEWGLIGADCVLYRMWLLDPMAIRLAFISCIAGIGISIWAVIRDRRFWVAGVALLLNILASFVFFGAYAARFLSTDR